jgi:hypothetical protein
MPTTHRQRILVLLLIVQDLITRTRPSRLCTAGGIRSDLCPVLAGACADSSPALLGAGDFPTQAGQPLTNSPVFSASSTARSRRCGVRPSRLEPTACWRATTPLQASKQLGRVLRRFHGDRTQFQLELFQAREVSWAGSPCSLCARKTGHKLGEYRMATLSPCSHCPRKTSACTKPGTPTHGFSVLDKPPNNKPADVTRMIPRP